MASKPVVLQVTLKARGELLKILFGLLIAAGATYLAYNMPPVLTFKIIKKVIHLKMTYAPDIAFVVAALAALKSLYVIALAKSTVIEAGGRSLKYSRGIFIREDDPIDFTGIEDFKEQRSLLDLVLGIRKFKIKSKVEGTLLLRGVSKEDAIDLFEHMNVHDNRNITDLVQSKAEKTAYEQRILAKQSRKRGETESASEARNSTDEYVDRKLKKYSKLDPDNEEQ